MPAHDWTVFTVDTTLATLPQTPGTTVAWHDPPGRYHYRHFTLPTSLSHNDNNTNDHRTPLPAVSVLHPKETDLTVHLTV